MIYVWLRTVYHNLNILLLHLTHSPVSSILRLGALVYNSPFSPSLTLPWPGIESEHVKGALEGCCTTVWTLLDVISRARNQICLGRVRPLCERRAQLLRRTRCGRFQDTDDLNNGNEYHMENAQRYCTSRPYSWVKAFKVRLVFPMLASAL